MIYDKYDKYCIIRWRQGMHHLNIDIPPKSRGLFFAGSVICLFIMIAMCGCISTSGLGGYRETTPTVNYHETSKNVDLAPSILHPLTFKGPGGISCS